MCLGRCREEGPEMWEAETQAGRPHTLVWSPWSGLNLASVLYLGRNPVVFGSVQMIYFPNENF